jgi:hypothetical protein
MGDMKDKWEEAKLILTFVLTIIGAIALFAFLMWAMELLNM